MLYCERCRALVDTSPCYCGSKKVREPKANDVVFLVTRGGILASMLENMLADNDIPCLKYRQGIGLPLMGGMQLGMDEYQFFVPFGALEKAKEILEEFFIETK